MYILVVADEVILAMFLRFVVKNILMISLYIAVIFQQILISTSQILV